MCTEGDSAGAEGVALLRESPARSGTFTLVKGAGGMFSARDLVGYGVPARDAAALYAAVEESEAHARPR